jgi:hypothetical protein
MSSHTTSFTPAITATDGKIPGPPTFQSVVSNGTERNANYFGPSISADGFVIYDSLAPDPAPGDTNGLRAITTTGDSTNRVDLILLGDGYTAFEIGSTFTAQIEDYLNYLFDDSSLTQPFGRYESYFNVYAVDVISNQSGADNPATGTFQDTALDATYYWDGVTERLLYVSDTKAQAAMNSALAGTNVGAEMRYVLVNDSKYGGGGGYFSVFAAGNSSAQELGLHEMGHSFGGLADEYGGNAGTYPGSEPSRLIQSDCRV